MSIALAGETYAFGPFHLTLPEGWEAAFAEDERVHDLFPPEDGYGLRISGYTKDTPIDQADLTAGTQGLDVAPVSLPSGLTGVTYQQSDGEDLVRFWMIRSGNTLAAIALSADPDRLGAASMAAQLIVNSIRLAEED